MEWSSSTGVYGFQIAQPPLVQRIDRLALYMKWVEENLNYNNKIINTD